ncbi:hypothetical protein SS50377_21232 [Spironucleus salmonicida]|uniref:Uncharacterized protein n=1 Tax=Spironucleus salmonicida TaxID=348837 RepID=V6LHG3_9EUKA|nr:hypothetical protein SS50377_21232 [Spironucleus salmonicida]|eukprot:EST44005.1 hypothetical protein SS50377_16314 [Spironucleus salmonicida]
MAEDQDLTWMQQEAQRLRLYDQSLEIIEEFKQIEQDIFFTLQYQKQQFPLLPTMEESLFISPFEMKLEECCAEIPKALEPPEVEMEQSSDQVYSDENIEVEDERNNNLCQVNQNISYSDGLAEPEIQSALNVFLQNRSGRELHLQTQPFAMFDLWVQSMKGQFYQVDENRLVKCSQGQTGQLANYLNQTEKIGTMMFEDINKIILNNLK